MSPSRPTPFLSRYDTSKPEGPRLEQPGRWLHDRQMLLQRIAQCTHVDGRLPPLQSLHSIPDIWGYARIFHTAWDDSRHELHREACDAWRGLLTLVALTGLSRFDMRLKTLALDGSKPFMRAAAHQRPSLLFEPSEPGSKGELGAILLRNPHTGRFDVAGLLVPSMLVLPARELALPEHPRIGWRRPSNAAGYPLGDPVATGRLSPRQTIGLHKFLTGLRQDVRSAREAGGESERALFTLMNRVDQFLNDVEALPGADDDPRYGLDNRNDDDGRALAREPLSFLKTVPVYRGSGAGEERSDTELPLRDDLGVDGLRAVFFADSLRTIESEDARLSDLTVWDDILVSETDEANVHQDLEQRLAVRGRILVTPASLFENRLVRLRHGDDTPAVHDEHGKLGAYLLPFRPATLLVYSPVELVRRADIVAEDGKIRVRLRITLDTPEGPLEHIVERTYDEKHDEVVTARVPPSLALWPTFKADDWRYYLLYQSWNESTMRVRQPITARALRDAASGQLDRSILTAIETRIVEEAARQATSAEYADIADQEILHCVAPPEALLVSTGDDSGLLVVDLPQALPVRAGVGWRVGIDFGTTNTCVAFTKDVHRPEEARDLCFADRTRLFFGSDGEDSDDGQSIPRYLAALYNFIPATEVEPPFLTLLRSRQIGSGDGEIPLAQSTIAFVTDPGDWLAEITQSSHETRDYKFGLKWMGDQVSRRLVEGFLRQLAIEVCAEARASGIPADRIDWRFSHPGSLPPVIEESYFDSVVKAVAEVVSTGRDRSPAVTFVQESSAAHQFVIRRQRRVAGTLRVVLDIGGHSTDIAIHESGTVTPVWEGSLDVGGQAILVDYWTEEKNWRTLIEQLHGGEAMDLADSISGVDLTADDGDAVQQRKIIVEMLLNHADIGRQLLPAEPSSDMTSEAVQLGDWGELLRRTRRRADFALFGLNEYVTRVIRSLVGASVLEGDQRIGLFFCGRGSRLFERLIEPDGPAEVVRGEDRVGFASVVEQRLRSAWSSREFVRSYDGATFTTSPKMEVALGCVMMPSAAGKESNGHRHRLPIGEAIKVFPVEAANDGRSRADAEAIALSADDGLEQARVHSLSHFELPDLPVFDEFVRRYNETCVWGEHEGRLQPGHAVLARTNDLLSTKFEDARAATHPHGYIQPAFVLALRACLENWDDLVLPPG